MQQRWFRHQHVIFDCDSTLSRIEGIDELAAIAGVSDEVKQMTDAAMAGDIALEEVYGRRLELIRPTRNDIVKLNQAYKNTAVQDARLVIEQLQEHGHDIYIVSGGLMEPVREFGISLGILESNIRAVRVNYNQLSGQWWLAGDTTGNSWSPEYLDFHQSPLTLSEGKKSIIDELIGSLPGRSLLVGDGMSDLLASSRVDQFVGYGGVVCRENVRNDSQVYINGESLLPILALCGGEQLAGMLKREESPLLGQIREKLDKNTDFTHPYLKTFLLNLFK